MTRSDRGFNLWLLSAGSETAEVLETDTRLVAEKDGVLLQE